MEIKIYDKNGQEIASVVVENNSYEFNEIMGDSYVQLEFKTSEFVAISKDSYIVYKDVRYTLPPDPDALNVTKISTCEYEYSVRFNAPQELLENIIMCHMADEGQTLTKAYERNFSLAGTAQEHLDMLIRNCRRLLANKFKVGHVDERLQGDKVVAYNFTSCKSALQLIANQFETEWYITGNETEGYAVNLGKCSFEEDNPTTLAYGFDNGIMSGAKRTSHKDANRCTHIAVQGGSQNINTLSQLAGMMPYGFNTLHFPLLDNERDGIGTIYYDIASNRFEGETGFNSAKSVLLYVDRKSNTLTSSLFQKDTDVVVEKAYDLSEFYPKKTRKVSNFDFQRNNSEFWIEDNTIEDACNYKTYQLGGEKITIVFQTGALAGKTFDVINYDHAKKRFECALADYDTIKMPSVDVEMWRPAMNDEFIVYGCALPSSYFHDTTTDPYSGAEWDMLRRASSILVEQFDDKYAYQLPIDSNWLSRRTQAERNRLKCGYWVHYVDSQLCGGGADIRITSVKTYLTRPLQPELTIGDEVKTVSIAQKLQQIQSSVSATYNYVTEVQQQTQQQLNQITETGIEQVQADWDETDETSKAYIKHKPILDNTFPTSETEASMERAPSTKLFYATTQLTQWAMNLIQQTISNHIDDATRHVTALEREWWGNKMNGNGSNAQGETFGNIADAMSLDASMPTSDNVLIPLQNNTLTGWRKAPLTTIKVYLAQWFQAKLTAQTAYSAKGSGSKVPQITTNSFGQVTSIEEVDIDMPKHAHFTTNSNAGINKPNKWQEIAYATMPNAGIHAFTEKFYLHDKVGYNGNISGNIYVSFRASDRVASHASAGTDNRALLDRVRFVYNQSTGRLSVYMLSSDPWNAWFMEAPLHTTGFVQGSATSGDLPVLTVNFAPSFQGTTKTSQLTNDSGFLVASDIESKVDKIEGKGLSSNDFTTSLKNKLDRIPSKLCSMFSLDYRVTGGNSYRLDRVDSHNWTSLISAGYSSTSLTISINLTSSRDTAGVLYYPASKMQIQAVFIQNYAPFVLTNVGNSYSEDDSTVTATFVIEGFDNYTRRMVFSTESIDMNFKLFVIYGS